MLHKRKTTVQTQGLTIKHFWVHVHVGTPDKKRADHLANLATQKERTDYYTGITRNTKQKSYQIPKP